MTTLIPKWINILLSQIWWVLSCCKDAPGPMNLWFCQWKPLTGNVLCQGSRVAQVGHQTWQWKVISLQHDLTIYSELEFPSKVQLPEGMDTCHGQDGLWPYSGPYTDDGILKNGFLGSLTDAASMGKNVGQAPHIFFLQVFSIDSM